MRIAVLLSGGVDSSVALRLLHAEGHDVVAFYLKIWLEDELAHLGECPWEDDLAYARAVCEAVGVPLEVVPLQRQYHHSVVEDAVAELAAGRTPSPDIWCNQRVKFGAFFDHLGDLGTGFDRVASGHYARLVDDAESGRMRMLKGVDPVKDQTYFLFQLDQAQLRRCLFPVGALPKAEVRELARRFELPNRDRPDSQGICFLGRLRYDDFVAGYLGEKPGEIREIESGRRLGEHRGFWFHTIGQRKGLGLSGGPWYVVSKDAAENVLYVSHREALESHRRDRFRLADVHWIAGEKPSDERLEQPFDVKLRHSPDVAPARLESLQNGSLEITLTEGDPGVAAGQWAVIYDGEECLGGGMIAEEEPGS